MSASVTLISSQSGKEEKYVLSSQEVNVLGRSPDCQIVLNPNEFVTVSRYHAQIELINNDDQFQWQISDKDTTNGTLINGEKIDSPHILNMGDRIMLGLKGPEFVFETQALDATVFVEIEQPETTTTSTDEIENKEKETTESESKTETKAKEKKETLEPKKTETKEEAKQEKEEKENLKAEKSEPKEKRERKSRSRDRNLQEAKSAKSDVKTEGKKEEKTEKAETSTTSKSEQSKAEPKKEDKKEDKKVTDKQTATTNQKLDSQTKSLFYLINLQQKSLIETGLKDIQCVSCSQDNNLIAIGSKDKTIRIWNLENNEEITTLSGHRMAIKSLCFSADGKTLASGSADKTIKIWNLENNEEITTLSGHKMAINSLCFSSDGKTLASGSADKTVKIWNLENNEEVTTLSGHKMAVNGIYFSPDGKTLFSGSADKTAKIWNWENNAEEKTIKFDIKTPIQKLILDVENKQVCIFLNDKISLFNYENEQDIYTIFFPSEFGSLVGSNNSGDILFSLINENTIGIYLLS